ncbi:MAG TPA: hypothetical protein VMM18_01050, partial [Gemmatimonadaceae bacterium]|nr:hypothetical protein [Gemmatimonadaceae bacterium]
MMRVGEHRARTAVLRLAFGMIAAVTLAACSETRPITSPEDLGGRWSGFVVSESRMLIGAPGASPVSGAGAVAWVSLSP